MNKLVVTLDQILLGNSLQQWGLALAAAGLAFVAGSLLRRSLKKQYERFAQTEKVEFMEVPTLIGSRTSTLFLLVLALFCGLMTLEISSKVRHLAQTVLTIAAFWQSGIWASAAALAWIDNKRRINLAQDRARLSTLGLIALFVRVAIWAVVVLLTLDNFDVKITTLVAGLGIGGVAVALATQNILGDLFASLSIILDKPFVIGDFLVLGDFMGSVEHIGIKSTRLRSLSGEQIVISNADMLGSRMRNYNRMTERRVSFVLRVAYETSRDQLAALPGAVKAIVEAQNSVRFDRCHLSQLGATAVEFETVYFVQDSDYNLYMNIQQEINLRICEYFDAQALRFSYPTQKVWLQKLPSPAGEMLQAESGRR